jgi:hypothetical protein
VENSYLINLVYWRLYRLGSAESLDVYYRYHETSFANEVIWRTHAAELLEIAAYTHTRRIGFVVVVFPRLTDVTQTALFVARVVELFRMNGVAVVNMAEQLVGQKPRQLIVSYLDPHPNVALHREVAALLVGPVRLAADESTTTTAGSSCTKPMSKTTG